MLWIPALLVALTTGDPAYQEIPDEVRSLFPKSTEALLWIGSLAQVEDAYGELLEIIAPERHAANPHIFGTGSADPGPYVLDAPIAYATKQVLAFDVQQSYQICSVTQATRDNWGDIELPSNFVDLGTHTGLFLGGFAYGPVAPQAPMLERVPQGLIALVVNVRRASRGRIQIARAAAVQTFAEARPQRESERRAGAALEQALTEQALDALMPIFDVPEAFTVGLLDAVQYGTAALRKEGTLFALDVEFTLERGPGMLGFADGQAPALGDMHAALQRGGALNVALGVDLGAVGTWLADAADWILSSGFEIDPDAFESFGTHAESLRVHRELMDACADLAIGLGDGLVIHMAEPGASSAVELSLPAIDTARAKAALSTIATSPLGPTLGLVAAPLAKSDADFCLWLDPARLEHGLGLADASPESELAPLPTAVPDEHLHVQVGEVAGRCTLTLSGSHDQSAAPRASDAPPSDALLASVTDRIDSASAFVVAQVNIGPWLTAWHAERELGLLERFKRPAQLERLAQIELPAALYCAFDGRSVRLGVHVDFAHADDLAANLEGVIDLF